jgi:putative acetyltransferase
VLTITRTNSDNTEFRNLIKLLDADLRNRYGALQDAYDVYNVIDYLDTVVIATIDSTPVGCACFKPFDINSVELKRMFVHNDYRGQGIATSILHELQQWAKSMGYTSMVLETADKQNESINLYKKLGFTVIPNYGQYIGMSSSVCMKKDL